MINKKNIILAFGNKEFNNSLLEVKNHFNFNLETVEKLDDDKVLEKYQGLIIHEDALKDNKFIKLIKNNNLNKIILHKSKKINGFDNIEKLSIPASLNQINEVVINTCKEKV